MAYQWSSKGVLELRGVEMQDVQVGKALYYYEFLRGRASRGDY